MEIPETEDPPANGPERSALRKGVEFAYYLHLAAMPTLLVFGLVFMSDDLRAAFAQFNEAGGWLTPVAKFSAFLACIVTVASALSRCTPPRSNLITLLLIIDTPVMLIAASYATGKLTTDILLLDGLTEMAAVTLAMIPLPFTGTSEVAADRKMLLPRMASVAMVLFGAFYYFVGGTLSFAWGEDWTGVVVMVSAALWSAFCYFRLMRTVDVNPRRGAWAGFAIAFPVFGGFFVAVFYGIFKGITQ